MASDAEVLVVDVRAVAKGYRLSKLIGYDVVNDRDEDIGTLDDLILPRMLMQCLPYCKLVDFCVSGAV